VKRPLIIIFLVLLLDQAVKIYVKTHFIIGDEYQVAPWCIIHFAENGGMAYGMEFSGQYGKIFLSVFRIAAVVLLGWYLRNLVRKKAHWGLVTSIALIFAGAIGNIIDSAFYGLFFSDSNYQLATFLPKSGGYAPFLHGQVVDMFYCPFIHGTFPSWVPLVHNQNFTFFNFIFNCSDAYVTIGVVSLLIFQRKFFPRKNEQYKFQTV